jgi:hypothetical protein
MDFVKNEASRLPAGLEEAIEKSEELGTEIATALRQGKSWLSQASWIGLDGYTTFHFMLDFHLCSIVTAQVQQ